MDKIGIHFRQVEEGLTMMDEGEIEKMVDMLKAVRAVGGTVYVCGNGGSHSTAGHFANDLLKMCRIRAVCVGDMGASMMAYGNDEGWENMFAGPLEKMVKAQDCVVGISCSGNSKNVVNALTLAKEQWGLLGGGLTGISNSSEINEIGLDALVHARVPDIRVQEDLHLIVCHAVVRSIQEAE